MVLQGRNKRTNIFQRPSAVAERAAGWTGFFVRLLTVARQSCSRFFGHFHQTATSEPTTTLSGVRSPFFVGCHWQATSGEQDARELVIEAFNPLQKGQPCLAVV